VTLLSREAFDALEFDAACSGDHQAVAQEMTRLADTGTQSPTMPRSEAYVRAGEQWLLADEPEAAVHGFMRALEDGGPSSVDPRAPLARAFFMLDRAADAEALISQLGNEPPRDPRMCDLLAELLVERADLTRALDWATAGVQLCLREAPGPVAPGAPAGAGQTGESSLGRLPGPVEHDDVIQAALTADEGDETELRLLLRLRFRIRNDLGLPEDHYDRLLDKLT
jgi:hypothetical protein